MPLKTECAHTVESLVVFELNFAVKAVKYEDKESNGILKKCPKTYNKVIIVD